MTSYDSYLKICLIMINSLIRNISLWYIMSTKSLWSTMKLPLMFIFSDVQKQRLSSSMIMPRMEIWGVVLIYNKHAQLGAQLLTKEPKHLLPATLKGLIKKSNWTGFKNYKHRVRINLSMVWSTIISQW